VQGLNTDSIPHPIRIIPAYPVCCQSTKASPRWLRQGSAALVLGCFLSGLIIWDQPVQSRAVAPIERIRPSNTKNIGINDIAGKAEVGFATRYGFPFSPTEICNFSDRSPRSFAGANDSLLKWRDSESNSRRRPPIKVNYNYIGAEPKCVVSNSLSFDHQLSVVRSFLQPLAMLLFGLLFGVWAGEYFYRERRVIGSALLFCGWGCGLIAWGITAGGWLR
jgi:hypothetical protein